MRLLAAYIMRGRMQALLVTAATAALSLVLPPALWLSSAALALVTLRQGAGEGLLVLGGSALASTLMLLPLTGNLWLIVVLVPIWLPIWALALTLRNTIDLGRTVTAAGFTGIGAVLALQLVLPQPEQWWRDLLERLVRPVLEQSSALSPGTDVGRVLDAAAGMMSGAFAASLVLTWWERCCWRAGGRRCSSTRAAFAASSMRCVWAAPRHWRPCWCGWWRR